MSVRLGEREGGRKGKRGREGASREAEGGREGGGLGACDWYKLRKGICQQDFRGMRNQIIYKLKIDAENTAS